MSSSVSSSSSNNSSSPISLNQWLQQRKSKAPEEGVSVINVRASSDLFDLVSEKRWHWAVRFCQEHPIDARYQDTETHETPLHVACQHRASVRIIKALLQAYPEATETPTTNGELPLHLACRFNASLDVLKELVKTDPAAVDQMSDSGDTAILALWQGRNKVDRHENYSTPFWQKIQVLLEALAANRQEAQGHSTSMLYMVHAVVSMSAYPYEVLEYVLHSYPEQVSFMDGSGRLALHIACTQPNTRDTKYSKSKYNVISKLLTKCPAAARTVDPNQGGRYPLHTALACGHQWVGGVKELFEQAPEVLHLPDPITELYPYQLAAIPDQQEASSVNLDTIFLALRAQPSALKESGDSAFADQFDYDEDTEAYEEDLCYTDDESQLSSEVVDERFFEFEETDIFKPTVKVY